MTDYVRGARNALFASLREMAAVTAGYGNNNLLLAKSGGASDDTAYRQPQITAYRGFSPLLAVEGE